MMGVQIISYRPSRNFVPPGRVCITPKGVENCRISSLIEALRSIGSCAEDCAGSSPIEALGFIGSCAGDGVGSSPIEALGFIGLSTGDSGGSSSIEALRFIGSGAGDSVRVGMGEEVGDICEDGNDDDDKRGKIACDEGRLPGPGVPRIALRSKRTLQLDVDVARETGVGRTGGETGVIRPGEVESYRS